MPSARTLEGEIRMTKIVRHEWIGNHCLCLYDETDTVVAVVEEGVARGLAKATILATGEHPRCDANLRLDLPALLRQSAARLFGYVAGPPPPPEDKPVVSRFRK